MDYRTMETHKNPAESFFLNTKAKTTKQKDRYVLRFFAEYTFDESEIELVDWSKLSHITILEFIEHKIESIQFATVNTYLTVLQVFAKHCFEMGAIDSEKYHLIRAINKYRGVSPDTGRALTIREISKIAQYFSKNNSARDSRNFALFALALGAGLRRAELVSINIEHIKKRELHVIGKGNKARVIYLGDFAFDAINNWRSQLNKKKGALFVGVYQSESIKEEQRLSIRAVNHIIDEICAKCTVMHFTTHDLRRTFATTLLHAENDIFTVQDLLGHSDPMTTKRYDKRGLKRKVKAINSLPF